MSDKQRVDTINTLLDIQKFSGESEGRLGPVLWFFGLAGAPLLVFIYFFYGIVPMKWFLLPYIFYVLRIALITIGEEGKRLEKFKRQLYDIYSSVQDIMEIKTIHKDGMIEYTNGLVCYFLVAYNAGNMDNIKRAQLIKQINTDIGRSFEFDIRGYNTSIADDLYRRYEGVKLFGDEEVARDFLAIIDYNRDLATKRTLMTVTVFCVYARLGDFQDVRRRLEGILRKPESKAFRNMRIPDGDSISWILSEDIDTYVSYEEIQRVKYSTGQFFGSHVVEYDVDLDEGKLKIEDTMYERGFIAKDE